MFMGESLLAGERSGSSASVGGNNVSGVRGKTI